MSTLNRIRLVSATSGHCTSSSNNLIYHFVSDNTVCCDDTIFEDKVVIIKLLPFLSMPSTRELLQLIIQIDDYLHESQDNIVFLSFDVISSKARCIIAIIFSFFNYYESPFDYIATFSSNLKYFNSQLLFLHNFNKILLNIYPNNNILQVTRIIVNIRTMNTYNYHFQLFNGNGEHIVTLEPTSVTENTLLFTNISMDDMLYDDVHIRLRAIDSDTGQMDTVFRTTLHVGYIDGIARVTKANIDTNYNIGSNFFMDMFFTPFDGIRRDIFGNNCQTSTRISKYKQYEEIEKRNKCLFELIKIRRKCSEFKDLSQHKKLIKPLPSKFTITSSPSPVKLHSNKENNQNYNNELMATISELNEFLGDEIIF